MVGKDKGKIGTINTIIKERNWVFVDGLNVVSENYIIVIDCLLMKVIFA